MNTNTNNNNTTTILGGNTMNNNTTTNNNNELRGDVNMNTVANNNGANNNNEGVVSMNNSVLNNNTTKGDVNMYAMSKEVVRMVNNGVVLRAKDVINTRHLFSTPDRFQVLDIYMEENKNGTTVESKVVDLSENPLFKAFGGEATAVTTTKESKVYKNFCGKFVQITMVSKLENKDLIQEASMRKFRFFIDTTNGQVFMRSKGRFLELTTGELVNKLSDNAKEYRMLLFSAGDVKKGQALFYRVDSANESSRTIYDVVAPGLYDEMMDKLTKKQAAKAASRTGLLKTTGKMNMYLDNFVVVYEEVLDILTGMSDGYALVDAMFYVNHYGMVTQAEACKIAEQDRLGLSQKFTTSVCQTEFFNYVLKKLTERVLAVTAKTVVKGRTTRYYNAKNRLIMVVVGDMTKATHLFDANTTKTKVDYDKKVNCGLTTMAVNHLSVGHLNSQVNESLFVKAAEITREQLESATNGFFIGKTKMQELEEFYNRQLDKKMAELTANILGGEKKAIKLSDNYPLSKLAAVNPNNPIVMNTNYSAAMDTLANNISGLSFETSFEDGTPSSFNMLLSCDVAATIGYKVIPDNCVFNAGIARMIEENPELADRFDRGVVTKAPKMGIKEYLNTHFMTFEEIDTMIESLNAPEFVKNMLKFKYRNAPEGVIYFPSNEDIFSTLAGSDADGDKVQVYFDEFVVSLCPENVVLIIDTTPYKEDVNNNGVISSGFAAELAKKMANKNKDIRDLKVNDNGEYVGEMINNDDDFVTRVFVMNVLNQMSIGVITFNNNKAIAMLVEALLGNTDYVKYFLKECGITEGKEDKALEVDDSIINEKFSMDLRKAMSEVKWTQDNIIAFLVNVNKIFRLYQEGAIDATKTGIYLNIIFTCNSISIERLYDIDAVIDSERKVEVDGRNYSLNFKKLVRNVDIKKVYKKDELTGKLVEVEVIHFVDAMGRVENKLINRVNNEFRAIIEANLDLFRYSDDNMIDFKTTLSQVEENYPEVLRGMYALKIVYNSLVSERASKDDLTDEERDSYKEELSNISNAVRALISTINFDGMPEDEKDLFIAEILLGVGCSWSSNRINPFAANKFAYTVCPEYAYGYFMGGTSYTAEATVLAQGAHLDGQTVSLTRGVSEFGLITDSKYTGEVVVSDGKAYANNSFDIKFVDETRAMIIYKETAAATVTRNSSIVVGDDGNIYFYQDVTTDAKPIVVGQMPNTRVFTGEVETDYYVDDLFYITINTRVGRQFVDVQYAVAYLSL
jgi:hypothetical protein